MTEVRTISQIDAEIAQAKYELENVRGTETEVYARIVGYYRSVRNWNKGKRDEYGIRKQFMWGDNTEEPAKKVVTEKAAPVEAKKVEKATSVATGDVYYEYFSRKTCPNCQPVKKQLEKLAIATTNVDVDTPEGLENASKKGVLSAPTVIAFDNKGVEIGRAHDVSELTQLISA